MSDQNEKNSDKEKPPQGNSTPEVGQQPKPQISLSKLGSRFVDSRREAAAIPGPSYAEQMEKNSPTASAVTEAFSSKKPEKAPVKAERNSNRPFSEFRQAELGKRIQVQLPKPVDIALRVHAASTGNLVTHTIDLAIEDYLKKHGIQI